MSHLPLPVYPPVSKWNVVMVSACNLRCRYCATGYGRFGRAGGVMDESTAAQLVEWIAGSMKSDLAQTHVSFSGGETFLHFDRFLALTDRIAGACGQRGGRVSFDVTTNGVLLNEARLGQLVERGIEVSFSIDGPPQVHDAMRCDAEGKGSFAKAYESWRQYRDLVRSGDVHLRKSPHCVFGPHSGSVREVADFWLGQGMSLVDLVPINLSSFRNEVEPDLARRAQCMEGLREWALAQAAQCSAEDFLERYRGPVLIYQGWQRLMFGLAHPLCTPGRDMLAADYDGSLYPCEAYVGTERWRLGDLWKGIDPERLQAYYAEHEKAAAICSSCSHNRACDKPCLALSRQATPRENLLEGCEMSRSVTEMLQETLDILMQEKKK
jgi:uncharacterized protein